MTLSASDRSSINHFVSAITLMAADLSAWALCFYFLNLFEVPGSFALALVWIGWVGLIKAVYSSRAPFWEDLRLTIKWVLCGVVGLWLVAPMMGINTPWATVSMPLALLLVGAIPLFRFLARVLLESMGLWFRPAVIFGVRENAQQAGLALLDERSLGYGVEAYIGFIDFEANRPELELSATIINCSLTENDLRAFKNHICIIAVEADQAELRDRLIQLLSTIGTKNVHVIPTMRGVPLFGLKTVQFFSHELLMVQLGNQLARPALRILKRTVDVVGSVILLVLLSPLFLYLIYKITRDGGSPFYSHARVGRDAQSFNCHKFRTMVIGADGLLEDLLQRDPIAKAEWDKDFKLKDDPRINAIGHFLRRTSIDELPQLWNVLKGEMSLVGPRPVVKDELERYAEDAPYYLMVRPGMTGLWQVSGRNDVDYDTRVYFDSWYVKNWSLWVDVAILFKTISAIRGRAGAY